MTHYKFEKPVIFHLLERHESMIIGITGHIGSECKNQTNLHRA